MINVLHILNYLGNGGSERYIYSLAKKLHNKSCRFYIAFSDEGKGGDMFRELGIDLIRLKMKNPLDIKAAWEIKKLCRKYSIDVLHTHFLRENYIGVLSRLLGNKAKIINTRHMLFENTGSVIFFNRLFTKFNDKIIAVSGNVRDRLLTEGIAPDKVKLIYTGVDPEEWNAPAASSIRKEFGLPEDVTVITSVARFTEEKGHDFLIDVIACFKDLIEKGPRFGTIKFKFILAGDGVLLGTVKEKAKSKGLENDIIFTGYRRDIKNIMKGSDIFIAHSREEALGISILEAMAAGLPVITTDSGGAGEIVNDRFNDGYLVGYGDTEGFAGCLAKLAGDEEIRETFINNGLKVIQEYFNLEKMAEETYNLYA